MKVKQICKNLLFKYVYLTVFFYMYLIQFVFKL